MNLKIKKMFYLLTDVVAYFVHSTHGYDPNYG